MLKDMKKGLLFSFITISICGLASWIYPLTAARGAALNAQTVNNPVHLLLYQSTQVPLIQPAEQITPTFPTAFPIPITPTATIEPAPIITPLPITNSADAISFHSLKMTDQVLYGPYDGMHVRLGLPPEWNLQEGAMIQLVIKTFSVQQDETATGLQTRSEAPGATLDVTFNQRLITTLVLDASEHTYQVSIPANALKTTNSDGSHDLYLFLDAAHDCYVGYSRTAVTIRAESAFFLPHTVTAPPTNLTLLPRPIYQANSYITQTATIVIPDYPTAAELQAALTLSAGFGRLTGGNLMLSLTPASNLSQETPANSHLIFVGKAASLPVLISQVELPAPIRGANFEAAGAGQDDGIIQMAVSPWNESRVILLVGGNTDVGVVKAAQAVSSGLVRPGTAPNLSLVAEVKESGAAATIPTDRTFGDLNYDTQTITGIGTGSAYYHFYIPPGQMAGQAPSLTLKYNHSALLDYARSGLVVLMNGQMIGSARFSDETTQLTALQIGIPANTLRPGDNLVSIEAELMPMDYCTELNWDNLWVSINQDSLLHLPLTPAQFNTATLTDLQTYPNQVISDPTLANIAFVLPPQDPLAWSLASQVAYDLGKSTEGALVKLAATFGGQESVTFRNDYDLIIIGKPSTLPIVAELKDVLPAPFENGSDVATEKDAQISYRLPAGISLGYLEMLPSPWKSERVIFGLFGSNDQGLTWVSNALNNPILRGKLGGNYSVIYDKQVLTSDTRLRVSSAALLATPVPDAIANEAITTTVTTSPAPNKLATVMVSKAWILPVIFIAGGLIVLVLLIAMISALVRRGSNR